MRYELLCADRKNLRIFPTPDKAVPRSLESYLNLTICMPYDQIAFIDQRTKVSSIMMLHRLLHQYLKYNPDPFSWSVSNFLELSTRMIMLGTNKCTYEGVSPWYQVYKWSTKHTNLIMLSFRPSLNSEEVSLQLSLWHNGPDISACSHNELHCLCPWCHPAIPYGWKILEYRCLHILSVAGPWESLYCNKYHYLVKWCKK